jgi:integrase
MEPKSKASSPKIDLAAELVYKLKKWKLAFPKGELDLLFPTEDRTPENTANLLYRRFFPPLRREGLPRMRVHNLRHTYANLLIAEGEHPKYIQSQLGHSSINVTMDIYGHLMESVNQKMVLVFRIRLLQVNDFNSQRLTHNSKLLGFMVSG